ncbi:hypothetical protein [Pseudanabaena sp. 'Roaring Creek']|uniref:hypothetical protein n=1 Tax=Pseudanabaena sp. 'Roaring Creek' TaxID=1681830 RepID=UPI0006D7CA60|nr:hypothetical protein [Pseudanabaena sp. 'Roaring Creek']
MSESLRDEDKENSLQGWLIASEILSLETMDVDTISEVIMRRSARLADKTFHEKDILALATSQVGYSLPSWFITGLTEYIKDCTCDGTYSVDWAAFNIYMDGYAKEKGCSIREKQ